MKPESFQSRPNSFCTRGGRASRLRAFLDIMLPPQPCKYTDLSEGAESVGEQLRGDKECPFSGVTSSSRVSRKVPESDARSVVSELSASLCFICLSTVGQCEVGWFLRCRLFSGLLIYHLSDCLCFISISCSQSVSRMSDSLCLCLSRLFDSLCLCLSRLSDSLCLCLSCRTVCVSVSFVCLTVCVFASLVCLTVCVCLSRLSDSLCLCLSRLSDSLCLCLSFLTVCVCVSLVCLTVCVVCLSRLSDSLCLCLSCLPGIETNLIIIMNGFVKRKIVSTEIILSA